MFINSCKLAFYFLALFLSSAILASPSPGGHWGHPSCLEPSDVSHLVSVIVSLGVSFDPTYVTKFLTDDFAFQSDGVNWALGLPLGGPSSAGKASFLAGAYNFTATYPLLNPPIEVLFVMNSCTDISYRALTTTNAANLYPVQAINILRCREEAGVWKVSTWWEEFNSASDIANFGVACKLPTSGG